MRELDPIEIEREERAQACREEAARFVVGDGFLRGFCINDYYTGPCDESRVYASAHCHLLDGNRRQR